MINQQINYDELFFCIISYYKSYKNILNIIEVPEVDMLRPRLQTPAFCNQPPPLGGIEMRWGIASFIACHLVYNF